MKLFLLLVAATTATPAPRCVTPREMDAVLTTALPAVVDTLSETCTATLPRNAFLSREGKALAERYRREGADAWPLARNVLGRAAGSMVRDLGEEGQRAAFDGVVGEAVSSKIGPQDCREADGALALVSLLPTESLGPLATMLFALLAPDARTAALPFTLCRPPEERSDDR